MATWSRSIRPGLHAEGSHDVALEGKYDGRYRLRRLAGVFYGYRRFQTGVWPAALDALVGVHHGVTEAVWRIDPVHSN